ncbi:MAG: hypothetical protein ACJ8EL_01660 [Rhizomicrobium sp.]
MREPFVRARDPDIVRFSCFRVRRVFRYTRELFIGGRELLVIRVRDLLVSVRVQFIRVHNQDIVGLSCFPVWRGIHWSSLFRPMSRHALLTAKLGTAGNLKPFPASGTLD